jgi:hypothetical protein
MSRYYGTIIIMGTPYLIIEKNFLLKENKIKYGVPKEKAYPEIVKEISVSRFRQNHLSYEFISEAIL